jgi:hypothetical protein
VAQFQAVPIVTPTPSQNIYAPRYDPWGWDGYWQGMADIVTNMIEPETGSLQKEVVRQAKVDTRRKQTDEFLYERQVLPTQEDERERARIENLRRSRNDPPITEVWSGKALNDMLLALQMQQARNIQGPQVPLNQAMLQNINVTSAQGGASLGVIRDEGKLSWPLVLRRPDYQSERTKLDQLAYTAYGQAASGSVAADTLDGMTQSVNALEAQLKSSVDEIEPNNYIVAKRYLNEMDSTIRALQSPQVSNYATRKWAAKGRTVPELVQNMTRDGLAFAPATAADQEAYRQLHRAMVAAYVPPPSPWDPLAK